MTEQQETTTRTSPLRNIGLLGAGALATVGLAFGAAGLAGAQDDDPTLDDPSTSEEDATTREDHREAHEARHQAVIDELLADGTITEDQVDDWNAVRDAITAHREAERTARLEGIAGVLDMTVEELRAAGESGQSLAEIAGEDLDALVEYLTAESTARINEAVADGTLTQEQADERLDGLADRIQSRIENGGGLGGRGGRGHHGHHGRRGPGSNGNGDIDAAEVSISVT